ncbi:hypothetical protein MKW92_026355 [Papaver armeniacum]|nr:hypothetical protein MKW92_026355 [Papaver armeniacum]
MSSSPMLEDISEAEKFILRCESYEKVMLFDGNHHQEAEHYLHAVDEVLKRLKSCDASSSTDPNSVQNEAIQVAMSRLKEEFKNLLKLHGKFLENEWILSLDSLNSMDSENSARSEEVDSIVSELDKSLTFRHWVPGETEGESSTQSRIKTSTAINDLRCIAVTMVGAGYTRECLQDYTEVRIIAIRSILHHLNFEDLSIAEVEWDDLDGKIDTWIHVANSCIRILFAREKKLSEQIFEGFEWMNGPAGERCFYDTVQGFAIQLLNFVNGNRNREGLVQQPQKLKPDIEEVFRSQLWVGFRANVDEILTSLASVAREMLVEFEKRLIEHSEQNPVLGGTIHPLASYVMNYIGFVSDYRDTLVELIVSNPVIEIEPTHPIASNLWLLDAENKSPLAVHMVWIVLNLVHNLEVKSQHIPDRAMSHLFVMNNTNYIVKKVREESQVLREMIGNQCLKKLSAKIMQSAGDYRRQSLERLLECLKEDGLRVTGAFLSGVSTTRLKERFKRFNSIFGDVRQDQTTWRIPDEKLRMDLRLTMVQTLIPAYTAFLGRHRGQIEKGSKHPGSYIRYEAEEIEDALMGFFQPEPDPS